MSLSLVDARTRAQIVSEVAYEIHLDLRDATDPGAGEFTATTRVTFAATPGAVSFLDLQHAREVSVELNGRPLDPAVVHDVAGERVQLPDLEAENTAVVTARLPYVTDGDGLNRFEDPADEAVYLGAYGGMDVARRVFACFDQPDLKASFTLQVEAPTGATVITNAPAERRPGAEDDGPGTWVFGTTPPISTYLFAVCVGPWASRTWEHAGLEMGWHCRASQAEDLDRDLPGLRSVTERAYDHYARIFTEPYAFGAYHQDFVPGHNWGAMETPGCVTFRDELLPTGSTDEALARGRAMTIAHEMAHMWFGDLVTFRWWEDTWLNESFADYMGFVVGGVALPGENALAEFDISRKAGGYAADLRPSTHPVAPRPEDVPDVDSAFNNFDAISYAKGNSCLRQLAFWLGEETFLAGVNAHLGAHRFGTATLQDFVASLQGVTDRDVAGWVEAWLRSTGHDTLVVERSEGPPVLHREGMRPHRVRVRGYLSGEAGRLDPAWEQVVDLADEPVTLSEADLVVPNATGDTFARVVLDDRSRTVLGGALSRIPDEHTRVIAWATLLDEAVRAELAPADLVPLIEEHLPAEEAAVAVTHVLARGLLAVTAVGLPEELPGLYDRLATVGLQLLAGDDERPAVVQSAVSAVLATSHDAELLGRWLSDGSARGSLTQAQRWQAVIRLAELDALPEDLLAAELERDGSSVGRLAELSARAARPDPAAKRDALEHLAAEGTSNREITALARGLWDPERRDLVDGLVGDFLTAGAQVARRGQAIGLVVGRATPAFRWTPQQLADLRSTLTDESLPPVLARTWADILHDQTRTQSAQR
ncbi:aminopeptidase N [Ornithinimicrobium panacihumi]|uniref:aminopeptidase N n=1 Tax=Ornithinimicrobium panacihumi TaxID=2008449 RepID=UPI003F8C7905